MQMDVKSAGGSLQVLGCITNTSEQKEEFPLMSYLSAHMSVKEGELEKPLDDIDASTLALKAETNRCLEEISRRAEQRNANKGGESQKDSTQRDKGAVLDRLRLMEWKRNEQDRLSILNNRAKHKPSEIHTLPQKNETDMDYFSGTGGRNRKMKKKAKKEVTTISLEELGCREIAKAALPQQRVYHPPPPPPAVNAWTQKSGSELFADVSAHSLTVYGGEDDEKTLRLVIAESIRTAREEQDRIINLYQRPVEDQRPTTSTSRSMPSVPAVSGEPRNGETQATTVTTVAGGVPFWSEPPLVGDGTWNDAASSDPQQESASRVGGDCSDSAESALKDESFSNQKSDAQQRGRTRNYSEGRSKETGRDGWNSESADVKYMGKANFIKRDNYPYSRNNNNRQPNRLNKHQEDRVNGEEDRKEGDHFEEGLRDSSRNFGNRPNNNQMGRNRGGRGGGQGRNWNHNNGVNERYQGPIKENRYTRNNNRFVPPESHGEEENWDEGVSSVISPQNEQQEDWSETNTGKGTVNESRSKNKNAESWSEPAPALAGKAVRRAENDETENWDEMDVKVENNSVITKTVTTSWNDAETSNVPKEENDNNSKNGLENWNQVDTSDSSRYKNYTNSRNKREGWNDSRISKNEGLSNSRNDKWEDRNGPGFKRGNFYSRNGRSEDWHETNTSQAAKRDNYFNHQNGWKQGQSRKYSEDKAQEERTEDWDEPDGSDRTSQRSSSSYHGYQRKRGTGLQNRNNWSKDGNQGNWNRRDESSRQFGKENYSGNRTYYRTRNYSENRLRSDDHVSDSSETSGSSKDQVHEKSSYQYQGDTRQQDQATCRVETESVSGNSGDQKVKGHSTVVSSSTGTRLSDKVLHYLAKIKEEGEPVEEKHQSHIIDMQEKQYTGAQYRDDDDDEDDDAGVSKVYSENDLNNNSSNKSESESMAALDTKQQHFEVNQSPVYYEESMDEQHQAAMSQPALVGEMPVENQQTLEPIKEWPEEPSEESREYDYVQPLSYPENHQLEICNGGNDEDLSKEESEVNQVPMENPSLMMPSVTERYVPNNFYTLVPPPSQLNTMMMALPSGMNMPIAGAPYGFSIPPPNVMVPGQMTQNMYQSGAHLPQDTSMKPNMAQEHIDQTLQQNSSMKQSQVMTSNANSNLVENNMHSHPNVSGSHLPQSPMYHPSMGQVYATYTGLAQGGPVHSNPLQVFIANSGLSQKSNINQSLPQNHHVTSANISHTAALSQPPNYNSTMTHPSYQHNSNGVVTNGPAMIDPQVQRLNSLKEGILKQVLSGNMTDPNQIAAAATVLNQLQPAPIPPSPLFMTASPQFYPGMNVSAIPNVNYTSSSMMSNGYCSGLLAVDTNGSAAPSVNGSPSPCSAAPVYGPSVSVPNTGTCSQVTQSHDGSYHPQMNPSRPVVMPSVVPQYVYHQPMYNPQLYQNGVAPEQLSLLQQQMASLSMSQQQQQTQQPQQQPPTQTLPPHLQQQLQQPPPGFNV